MQGPALPISLYKSEEKEQAKNPHAASCQWRGKKPLLFQFPQLLAQYPSTACGLSTDCAQQPDGTWARTGEYITLVSKDSALLGLPQAVEERVAAGGNHSTMVKFSSRSNPGYTKALDSLYRFEKEAKAVVEKHFEFCAGE